VLYVRSSVQARRRRRRRIRTRSALESDPMASAQEKASGCCGSGAPARGAPVAVRAIAASPTRKVAMAARDEHVSASSVGGGALIEEIATVQPTTAKASSKGIRVAISPIYVLLSRVSIELDHKEHELFGNRECLIVS
jgi:hypothetical protein